MSATKDKIFLDAQNMLRIVQHGIFSKPKAANLLHKTREFSSKLLKEEKDILILADVRDLKGFEPGTEHVGLEIRQTIPFIRMAIVVDDDETKIVQASETVTAQSSRKKEIGYFNNEAAAIKWLKTDKRNR